MIDFAQLPTGSIKIGTSDDVEARRSSLANHYGTELALLATMPGDRSVEAEIHERFSHLRLGRTEQFKPRADLMRFIGKPPLVGINPETVEVVQSRRTGHAMRLDLNAKDNERLERCAEVMGLTKASFARMAVLAMIRQREEHGAK